MDKFINAFSRSQHKKDDEGRSHQFAKRLAATTINDQAPGPTLALSELSPLEKTVYQTWWDGLDPFGLGTVLDEALHPFLFESGLDQEILRQIIGFYTGETRYVEEQFYGILRLIAHGQSGRKINRDLVALGAPLAHFNSNPIDYRLRQGNINNPNQNARPQSDAKGLARNTWWGQPLASTKKDTFGATTNLMSTSDQQQQQQQQQTLAFPPANTHRHSYAGSTVSTPAFVSLTQPPPPLPTANVSGSHRQVPSWTSISLGNNMAMTSPNTPLIPLTPTATQQQNAFDWAEQALSSSLATATTTTHHQHPQQQQQQQQQQQHKLEHPFAPTATMTTPTATGHRNGLGHSRSRSVPYASQDISSSTEFTFDTVTATQTKQNHTRPTLSSSRSSMDTSTFHRLLHQEQHWTVDQGQSLLLTQKFVPPASTTKSTNPFEDNDDDNDDEDGHNLGSSDGEDICSTSMNGTNDNPADHHVDQSNRPPAILKSPFHDDQEDGGLTPTKPTTPTNSLKEKNNTLSTTSTKVTPTMTDLGNFTFSTSSSASSAVNQRSNGKNIPAPPVPSQVSKPAFLRYERNHPPQQQTLKRSQSQHSGSTHGYHQQRAFMSQGAFLLATSSSSSSVKFPTVQPSSSPSPADDTTRLFRHRSAISFPRK